MRPPVGSEAPSAWDIAIQDPSEFHNPANTIDSADFVLQTDDNNVSFFILQLFPNSTAGEYTYYYQIFDPANREDLVNISIKFIVNRSNNISLILLENEERDEMVGFFKCNIKIAD